MNKIKVLTIIGLVSPVFFFLYGSTLGAGLTFFGPFYTFSAVGVKIAEFTQSDISLTVYDPTVFLDPSGAFAATTEHLGISYNWELTTWFIVTKTGLIFMLSLIVVIVGLLASGSYSKNRLFTEEISQGSTGRTTSTVAINLPFVRRLRTLVVDPYLTTALALGIVLQMIAPLFMLPNLGKIRNFEFEFVMIPFGTAILLLAFFMSLDYTELILYPRARIILVILILVGFFVSRSLELNMLILILSLLGL